MKILVINCGSSSAKYDLFDVTNHKSLGKGKVERIAKFEDYVKAVKTIRDTLLKSGALGSVDEIKGIGHRVVHGGEEFSASTLINKDVIKSIEKFVELAPLHNPPSLAGIRACMDIFPKVPQVAVFDTAFHHTMPSHSYIYGIPYEYYEKLGVRKYGFHGTSHRFVAHRAAELLKKPLEKLKLVTVHLGNGCSITAVDKGMSVDTSMGFTPLEGLLMGTRSGDLDPAIIFYIMEREKMTPKQMNDILNKKSGFLGVSGKSNDMRDILELVKKGDKRAKIALNIFLYRIKKYIGAYAAAMGGVDAVIMTAGISENVPMVKKEIEKGLKPLFGKKTKFMVVPTNEELLIAKDTYNIIKNEGE